MQRSSATVLIAFTFALGVTAVACHGSEPKAPAGEPTTADGGTTTTSGVIDEQNARDKNNGSDRERSTPIAPEVSPPSR